MEVIPILRFIKFFPAILLISCNLNEKKYRLYYSNGDIRVKGSYINDMANGFWKSYYPNGKLKTIGEYCQDSLVGRWIWYYEDGTIMKDTTYLEPKIYD